MTQTVYAVTLKVKHLKNLTMQSFFLNMYPIVLLDTVHIHVFETSLVIAFIQSI